MRYSFVSAAILALTSSVFAVDPTANFDPITIPTQDQNVAAGSSLDITWEPSTVHTGSVTIALLQGSSPSTLETGQTIKAGLDQTLGKYTWDVPTDLKSFATYGFSITLDSSTADPTKVIFQYSFPFHITGLSSGSSSSSSATGGTTTVHLSTGTGYSASATSTSSSVSSSVNITSTYAPSSTYSAKPTTLVVYTSTTGNVTLSATPTPSTTASSTSGSAANSTSTTPATATANAAVSNLARGSFAVLGGLVLAFAL